MKEEPIIIADRDKISHVFFNLMSNALKYTPKGGSINISLAYTNHTYTIKVSDTGKGVAKEELPRLFERFYQARGTEGGTGIGLSIVKAFVELHKGEVHGESEEGKDLPSWSACLTHSRVTTQQRTWKRRSRQQRQGLSTTIT